MKNKTSGIFATIFFTLISLCYRYPRMLFHVCMVHYPRTKQDYKINLPFMRIFHGNSFPDGYVHFIRNC